MWFACIQVAPVTKVNLCVKYAIIIKWMIVLLVFDAMDNSYISFEMTCFAHMTRN